ncbi:MAG: cyclase family protein [Erysipelotrichaceae bacterium]|nr:cyclase family protein [Erysipelotrichaceae bacterium]
MKIYDISQEIFTCEVYPGNPGPERVILRKKSEGGSCNMSAFSMCVHNGTHVDAPYHFINKGKQIDEVDLNRFIGKAFVVSHEGDISKEDAEKMLEKARKADEEAVKRILVKGNAVLTEEAAEVFAENHTLLYGNESQTVGSKITGKAVHMIMLGAEIVLLEGIRLNDVEEGVYLLNCAPLNLGGSDGAPCRAVLISD